MRNAQLKRCLIYAVFCASCSACGSQTSNSPTSPDEVPSEAVEVSAPPKQLPPPGEPGPFLLQITDQFPTQVFGSAATTDYFAIAIQGDARDVTLCPQTQLLTCFKGVAYIVARMNPNEPKAVPLYESDTQSGARVDDIAAVGTRFVFAVNDGAYVGDKRTASLVVADQTGKVERSLSMDVQNQVVLQSALVGGETEVTGCSLLRDAAAGTSYTIHCESLNPISGSRSALFNWSFATPVRSFEIAQLKDDLLVVWTAGGRLYASFSDDPMNGFDLGTASAVRPLVAAGHEQFVIAWQDENLQTRVTSLTRNEEPKKSLALSGITHRSLGGLVATTAGFVLAFRYENAQQLAVIEPDLSAWNLVEGSATWRQLSDYASLDIQDAHQGKFLWQTVESLIGEHK